MKTVLNNWFLDGVNFHPDYQTYLDYATTVGTLPDAAHQSNTNTLINTLDSYGIWSKLDRLWLLMEYGSSEVSRVSLKNPGASTNCTLVDAPTWAAGEGWSFDGSNDALNTNTILSTLTNYTLNDNSSGFYMFNNTHVGTGDATAIGVNQTGNVSKIIQRLSVPREARVFNNNNTAQDYIGSGGLDPLTLYANQRTASNSFAIYKAGVNVQSSAFASVAVPTTRSMYIGANNNNGALGDPLLCKIGMVFIGGSFDQANFNTAITTWISGL